MTEKILWNTVVIKVPSEFISADAKGKIKIAPPLTKRGGLAKKRGKTAINIVASDGDKVEIENAGEYQTPPEKKVRQKRVLTEAQIKRRNENKEIVKAHKAKRKEQEKENEAMGKEDRNVGESMAEKMARLRAMRKNVTIRKKDKHKFDINEED